MFDAREYDFAPYLELACMQLKMDMGLPSILVFMHGMMLKCGWFCLIHNNCFRLFKYLGGSKLSISITFFLFLCVWFSLYQKLPTPYPLIINL